MSADKDLNSFFRFPFVSISVNPWQKNFKIFLPFWVEFDSYANDASFAGDDVASRPSDVSA